MSSKLNQNNILLFFCEITSDIIYILNDEVGLEAVGLGHIVALADAGEDEDGLDARRFAARDVRFQAVADHGGVLWRAAQLLHRHLEDERARLANDHRFYASCGLQEGEEGACTGQRAVLAGEGEVWVGADEIRALVDEQGTRRHLRVGGIGVKASHDEHGRFATHHLFHTQ